jgi:penicillin G amidase
MRIIPFFISAIITVGLVLLLNTKWGGIPSLGRFLSPQHGFWQNAEATDYDYSANLKIPHLKGKVNVYIDDRLIPHIFADYDEDAYFVQGYLHARFRLWQMEFQTMAAAGRISEILGSDPRFLRFDREQRRLGMVYGAENTLKEMEADPLTKSAANAYTAGVNSYIESLTESQLPLEYKLLDYKPEPWSNLKIALFIKQMTKDLAGYERDLEFTNSKSVFSVDEMKLLYPEISDSSLPIIPKGTVFSAPGVMPVKPAGADSLYFDLDTVVNVLEVNKPDPLNGSNNWAVSGIRTSSGVPILANDPHLNLTLPSIWFEMQISTPSFNAYGVTFPGSPSIIIGYNDHIAFGFTNAGRDVKDYYQIRFRDESKREYWFDSSWRPTTLRVEEIKVKGSPTVLDTVAYTVFGPVMYDQSFTIDSTNNMALAVRWSAHDASNEPAMWLHLNKAIEYNDYTEAIKHFTTPGQNMLYASKAGDIAIWQQARFPARWEGQGLYVMPGEDSSYMWQGYIPQEENPHIVNPASGFIQSANQRPVDTAYPYFIPGHYHVARGIAVETQLQAMQQVTPDDMKRLQNDVFSPTAADAVPFLLKYVNAPTLNATETRFLNEVKNWDFYARAESKAVTIYQAWMDSLQSVVWMDEFSRIKQAQVMPDEQTLLEALLRDSAFRYVDDITTPEKESINQQVTKAFRQAVSGFGGDIDNEQLVWWKFRNPTIYHLLRHSVLPFACTGLKVGGWGNTINAMKVSHGPSWRMVVHLTEPTEAYGVYPGGQSGHVGSRYYDNFIDTWAQGKYYSLWMMKETESTDKRIKWTMTFSQS